MEKENSKIKPVVVRLKTNLESHSVLGGKRRGSKYIQGKSKNVQHETDIPLKNNAVWFQK